MCSKGTKVRKRSYFGPCPPKTEVQEDAPVDKAQSTERVSRFCGLPHPEPTSLS